MEKCAEGYDRKHPVTFEPCDICAEGFFDPGSGCIRKLINIISKIFDYFHSHSIFTTFTVRLILYRVASHDNNMN